MQIDPLLALGVTLSTAGDGCRLRDVQRFRRGAPAGSGCKLEQRVVSAFRVRGDQLYAQLGVRGIRGARFLDWRVLVDDMAEEAGKEEGVNEVVDNHGFWVSTRGLQSRFFGSKEKS